MSKPKIAMLVQGPLRAELFTDDVLAKIHAVADVRMFDGDRRPTPDEAAPLLADAELAVCSWGSPRFDAALLAHAPRLQKVVYAAGSIKPIVSDALVERGVTVTSGAAVIAQNVAEYTLGLIITSLKRTWPLARETAAGRWRKTDERSKVRELYGLSVGVVGAGSVGRALLRLLAPFEIEVLLYDPFVSAERAAELGATRVELDQLLERADVVTLHAPNLPGTQHMINRSNLPRLRDGSILINTARGGLIDEDALIEVLKTGRIFACLDVTDPEPPAADHPFCTLDNVLLTPHIAGGVGNGRLRLGRYALDEIEAYARGEAPHYPVDLSRLDAIA